MEKHFWQECYIRCHPQFLEFTIPPSKCAHPSLSCSLDSRISLKKSKKVILNLAEETTNLQQPASRGVRNPLEDLDSDKLQL